MKKSILITTTAFAYCLLQTANSFPQGTAINKTGAAAHNSALLDLSDTTKGILIPRMKKTNKLSISSPATGLMVYQTDDTTGFWYYNGVKWVPAIGTVGATGPTGPGGSFSFKRIFVSSVSGSGDFSSWAESGGVGGITGGDNICQSLANTANLGGSWKAFLSSSSVDAYTRFSGISEPLYNIKGHLIYFHGFELYCTSNCSSAGGVVSLRPINFDEYGTPTTTSDFAWTGSTSSGIKSTYFCSDWTSNLATERGATGSPNGVLNEWKSSNSHECNRNYRLYCIEM